MIIKYKKERNKTKYFDVLKKYTVIKRHGFMIGTKVNINATKNEVEKLSFSSIGSCLEMSIVI